MNFNNMTDRIAWFIFDTLVKIDHLYFFSSIGEIYYWTIYKLYVHVYNVFNEDRTTR